VTSTPAAGMPLLKIVVGVCSGGDGNGVQMFTERDDKPTVAIVREVSVSASQLNTAQKCRHLDHYVLPHPKSGYIPNKRFRDLQKLAQITAAGLATQAQNLSKSDVHAHARLRRLHQMPHLHTLGVTVAGETVNRSVINHIFSCLGDMCKRRIQPASGEDIGNVVRFVASGSNTKPEPALFHNDIPLMCSEAKRVEDSTLKALPQGCAMGADCVITQRRFGISVENCTVPILVTAGNSLQFYGAFLLPDAYPTFCTLSENLSIFDADDFVKIFSWVKCLAEFLAATVEFGSNRPSADDSIALPQLALNCHFFKPVRVSYTGTARETQHQAALARILNVYKKLHDLRTENASHYVQFPKGVVQLNFHVEAKEFSNRLKQRVEDTMVTRPGDTDNLTPLLVFDFLAPPWTNKKPPRQWADNYISAVNAAIDLCSSAKLVLLDARPANVMWRTVGHSQAEVEVKLIDFEDVVPENFPIDGKIVKEYEKDVRYNHKLFTKLDKVAGWYVAPLSINDYWKRVIAGYVSQTQYETFTQYMKQHRNKDSNRTSALEPQQQPQRYGSSAMVSATSNTLPTAPSTKTTDLRHKKGVPSPPSFNSALASVDVGKQRINTKRKPDGEEANAELPTGKKMKKKKTPNTSE